MKFKTNAIRFLFISILGCAAAHFENIEQGAGAHGIDIDKLIEDLNAAIEAK